jgi:site-specific DNA recombinase
LHPARSAAAAALRATSCGRGLTGSWSKGRSEYYAYYHCRPGCRAVNITKGKLEGLFANELALLQPTPGYMRLLKESLLQDLEGAESSRA